MSGDNPGTSGSVTFRFYAELNDHLSPGYRREVAVEIDSATEVGQLIEQLGVPMSEVDLILVEGRSAHPGRQVRSGERVAVYPVFESFDVSSETRMRSRGLRELRFLVDRDLGELAALLVDAGCDVCMAASEDVVAEAETGARVLLTQNADLVDDSRLTHGLGVVGATGRAQLAGLARRLHLP